ncbi:MAG: UPF0175 family protein [Cyanobacteriota bacterium]|nr:UPF0175 family protein [Cyanobacteriota bacterium]
MVISNEILEAAGMSETEFIREIAIMLFRQKKIGLAKASYIAQMNQIQFMRFLGSRGIPIHYGITEFKEDLKTIESMGL